MLSAGGIHGGAEEVAQLWESTDLSVGVTARALACHSPQLRCRSSSLEGG